MKPKYVFEAQSNITMWLFASFSSVKSISTSSSSSWSSSFIYLSLPRRDLSLFFLSTPKRLLLLSGRSIPLFYFFTACGTWKEEEEESCKLALLSMTISHLGWEKKKKKIVKASHFVVQLRADTLFFSPGCGNSFFLFLVYFQRSWNCCCFFLSLW